MAGVRHFGQAWVLPSACHSTADYTLLGDLAIQTGSTPATNVYDRHGRVVGVYSAGSTNTRAYTDSGRLLSESFDGLTITNGFDNLLRRTSYGILNPQGTLLASASYSYGSADGRLQTVSSGNNSGTYSYLANSPLVDHILFQQNGQERMTTSNTFDSLNRLTRIQSRAGILPASDFSYQYNAANHRTRVDIRGAGSTAPANCRNYVKEHFYSRSAGDYVFATPDLNSHFRYLSDGYFAFGNARVSLTGSAKVCHRWLFTTIGIVATASLSDTFTFGIYWRLDHANTVQRTAMGYRLETSGFIQPFNTSGKWQVKHTYVFF
jgi:hypothetical protein